MYTLILSYVYITDHVGMDHVITKDWPSDQIQLPVNRKECDAVVVNVQRSWLTFLHFHQESRFGQIDDFEAEAKANPPNSHDPVSALTGS